MNKSKIRTLVVLIILLTISSTVYSVSRFPKPEFESDYAQPKITAPLPRSNVEEVVDIAALVLALSFSAYFAIKKRSRRALFVVMLLSLAYFGFWRKGCVCSVGSLQNIVLIFSNPDYSIPISIILFFILPLLFALFFGRVFCSSVCPLGAIQDIVIYKPKKLPFWLNSILSLIPYFYLSFAILLVATNSMFLICKYDPFVSIFRFGGSFGILVFGASLLILGMFVARPYCRFLCPYGVLLGWMSRFSKWHISITPTECIQCRLCETSCPFEAIDFPTTDKNSEDYSVTKKRVGTLLLILPLIILISGWAISTLHPVLSKLNSKVRLAEQIQREDSGEVNEMTLDSQTFRALGTPNDQLFAEVAAIQNQFKIGGWIVGGFLGLVICLNLIALSLRHVRKDYIANRERCLSCGRCFEYCPRDEKNFKGEQPFIQN